MIMRKKHWMKVLPLLCWTFAYMQNFAEKFHQFDAGSAERTFMLISPTTVLVYNLNPKEE